MERGAGGLAGEVGEAEEQDEGEACRRGVAEPGFLGCRGPEVEQK